MHEYIGVIHIHSDYSDGSKSIPEIAEIARSTGLDYLLFADHMTLQPLRDGCEGWHGTVLVLIGYEIHDPENRNHYLAFSLGEMVEPGLSADQYVKGVKRKGGMGFIAHPDEQRAALPEYPSYPWTAWDVNGFDGIEIWNHMSEWMEGLTKLNKLWHYLLHRDRLAGPTPNTLKRWDELNGKRRVVGIGGLDVHAYRYRLGPFTLEVFPYRVQFKSIRTHVLMGEPLSGDVRHDKPAFYGALISGNCFISHYRRGDARGFRFWAESEARMASMGDSISATKEVELHVKVPQAGEIRLISNGEEIFSGEDQDLSLTTDSPGVYRVEVYRGGKAWIFSNHIRVTKCSVS